MLNTTKNAILNLVLNTDSYKTSHFKQYPPETEVVSSYIEARAGDGLQDVVFFGLQMFIQDYLMRPISRKDIDEAEEIIKAHGMPFNRAGWEIILNDHGGRLPLLIEALPEGTIVPRGTPMVQVRNTDPRLPWLTSYMETALLRAVWYPTTVASTSYSIKKLLMDALNKSSDDPLGQIPFKLHDFGARGATSLEQAGVGGAAHLTSFMGTDTIIGTVYAREFYGEDMAGFAVPGSEHSTMTSWGYTGEVDAYRNMLRKFPEGIVSVVSDSYDIEHAVNDIWGNELKDEVLKRSGTLVVRPDSGEPIEMILMCLESLWESYGGDVNSKGYKVLHPKVRIIQGDGMDLEALQKIIPEILKNKWSLDNIAFGMGGGLLQGMTRDTLRFAMKASAIKIDGKWKGIQKKPASDPTKGSKKGFQQVKKVDGVFEITSSTQPVSDGSLLRSVYFLNKGCWTPVLSPTTFLEIRNRIDTSLV